MIIDKNTLEIKSCLNKINPNNGKEIFIVKEEPKIKNKEVKKDIKQENLNNNKIDIELYNDERTGKEIIINKKTEWRNKEKKEDSLTGEIKL